ncbi:hypothetical protein ACFQ07_16650 [Actinomadura adrarensis]|uniref:Low affinity iron permease n=1 Tax=Actinomadura adrarensis TaxID=1819600 RepID=A0ABW3CHU9_9ACTN
MTKRPTPGSATRLPVPNLYLLGILFAVSGVLTWTAPGPLEIYNVVFMLAVVGLALAIATVTTIRFAKFVTTEISEVARDICALAKDMEADPRTAPAAQRAMDRIRNMWGDEADQWLKKSDLN